MIEIFNMFMISYTFRVVSIGCMLLGIITAIIGTFAVLKKESLLGDSIAHASLAGVCIAFIVTGKKELPILLLGALLIGIISIVLIHIVINYSKVKFDSAIALNLATFFGLGLVLLTYLKKIPGAKKAGLNRFIFGQASTLLVKDIYFVSIIGIIILVTVILFWKEIKISIFDKDYALTLGINSKFYSFLISFLIVITVIIGIQIAGVILITSMLIAPSVAARQFSNKLNIVVVLASIFGAISGFMGTAISATNTILPTGPMIIIFLSFFVFFAIIFSPNRGLIGRHIKNYRRNKEIIKKYDRRNIL